MDFHHEVSSLNSLASLAVANIFWKASWKAKGIQLNEAKRNIERNFEFQLICCREEAIENLDTFFENEKFPLFFKSDLIEIIFYLQELYHQLFLWKNTYDPHNKINLLAEGQLYAPNFFNSAALFSDYNWAKRFVNNTNYNILSRFCLACLYCFEEECESLWSKIRNFIFHHLAQNFDFIEYLWQPPHSELISYMILQIEHKLTSPEHDIRHRENFWRACFTIAAEGGYEYSVYYFWDKMSYNEKMRIMDNNYFFELMSLGIDSPYNYISYFLFSELSDERIDDLTEWTRNNGRFEAWYNRMLTFSAESPYSIIHYIPIESYFGILTSLSHRIWRYERDSDITMFKDLAMNLDHLEMEFILESRPYMLEILAKDKSIHVFYAIICNLSLQQKENILLNNLYGGGVTVISVFSEEEEFDIIYDYFCLFLIDAESFTEKTLRKDASFLLEKFSQSAGFLSWCETTSKENVNNINTVIDTLQAVLAVLKELCETACKENIEYNYLSSFSFSESKFQ